MPTYVMRDGVLVEKTGETAVPPRIHLISDEPAGISPIDGRPLASRPDRRAHMREHGLCDYRDLAGRRRRP